MAVFPHWTVKAILTLVLLLESYHQEISSQHPPFRITRKLHLYFHAQRAMERAILGVLWRDKIRNKKITKASSVFPCATGYGESFDQSFTSKIRNKENHRRLMSPIQLSEFVKVAMGWPYSTDIDRRIKVL